MMPVDLWVPGRPKPAERPRLGRRSRAFTPQATIEAENTVAAHWMHRYGHRDPYTGPLALVVDYTVHGHRIQLFPTTSPSAMAGDLDNYLKTTMDGLQKGNAFLDAS